METYVIGLYFVCVENNNGMNLEQGPLLYASVRSRRRRIVLEEKREKKVFVSPLHAEKGRGNGRTCALSLRPWWTLSTHHPRWISCMPSTSRSRPPDASRCPRRTKRAHNVSKSASVVIDIYYAGEKSISLPCRRRCRCTVHVG